MAVTHLLLVEIFVAFSMGRVYLIVAYWVDQSGFFLASPHQFHDFHFFPSLLANLFFLPLFLGLALDFFFIFFFTACALNVI